MIRYGILSTSSIAPRFIAAVRESGTGEIVAVSSRTIEKAREKASEWNISSAYGSHGELLEDENVEAVYISAVNSQHYRWAREALLHGRHVTCEKPCTIREEDTCELFAIAKERGLFLMEAQKMLFLPAILEAKKRIASGALGSIRVAEFTHSFDGSYNAWMYDEAAGGGPLLSSGIYAVQLMIYLFGPIENIRGVKSSLETGVEWQYILTGETKSGVLFTAKNSTRAILDNTCRIYGENGWLELPEYWKARKVIFHISRKEPETVEFPCRHELRYEAEHIAQCFRQGLLTSQVVTPEISVAGIAALEQVMKTW